MRIRPEQATRIGDSLLAVTLPFAVLVALLGESGAGRDRVLAAVVLLASVACFLSLREYCNWRRFGNWKTDTSGTVRVGGSFLIVGCSMALANLLLSLVDADARHMSVIEVSLSSAIVGWSLVLFGRRRQFRKSTR